MGVDLGLRFSMRLPKNAIKQSVSCTDTPRNVDQIAGLSAA